MDYLKSNSITDSYEYFGCYRDISSDRNFKAGPWLEVGPGKGININHADCVAECDLRNQSFFSLQAAKASDNYTLGECFCGNYPGSPSSKYPKLPDDDCNCGPN